MSKLVPEYTLQHHSMIRFLKLLSSGFCVFCHSVFSNVQNESALTVQVMVSSSNNIALRLEPL